MHRRMYLRTLVASGIVGACVTTNSSGSIVQSAQAQSNSGWSQQAKLVPEDGDAGDWFGMTALDGTTAMVGAPRDDSAGTDAGSVYVFNRVNDDWAQQTKLISNDGGDNDRFGFPVAVDGTTAVVGARFDDNDNGDTAGAAYIFENDNGWSQTTKLTPNDGDDSDRFGRWVGIDESTVVVGAITDEDPNGSIAGSAYVFERSNGDWEQAAKLAADDGDEEDQFGVSIAVDGSTVVVGADGDEDPNGEDGGSAYVFEQSNGEWTQAAKLTADDGEPDDDFGLAVGIDKSMVIVGAPGDQVEGTGTGSVYVFSKDGGNWTKQTKLSPTDGDGGDRFGISLDIAEGTVVIGADQNDNENGDDAGAAYVYDVAANNGEWTQRTKLLPEDGDGGDRFGYTVSYDGTGAVVGARDDENLNGDRTGSAYVFTAEGGDNGPPAFPGQENPPQDLDGDGLYEDINGDGEFTIADVHVFFENRDADVVQNNAEFFNFAGSEPADVTLEDVEALYQLLIEPEPV